MARVIRPFDDSQRKDRRRASTNQSTNTSTFDAYRQGVELTHVKHYALGIAKIHSGYNDQLGNHETPQFDYGQERPIVRDDNSYLDGHEIDSLSLFEDSRSIEAIRQLTLDDTNSIDGTIEPLEIRKVANWSTHSKDVIHKIWGVLDEGNVSLRLSSDVFVYIVRRSDLTVGSFPFVDEADVAADMPLFSESNSPDNRKNGAFYDDQDVDGIIQSTNMSADLLTALRAMDPPTTNVQPPSYVQPGASGFPF